jgi:hypothetical protein
VGTLNDAKAARRREKAISLTPSLRACDRMLAHKLQAISRFDAKGILMTTYLNRIAWFAALLTIIAWAFVPRVALAYPVKFPSIPNVDTLPLPPVPSLNAPDRDR